MRDLLETPLSRPSRGQEKLAGLLPSMVGDPPVLLLDEPTAYLDPGAVHLLRRRILHLREGGATIVLSSHHLEEIERVADEVVFFSRGRTVRHLTPRGASTVRCRLVVPAWPEQAGERWRDAEAGTGDDGRVVVSVPCASREELARVEGFLLDAGETVYDVQAPDDFLEEGYREFVDE